MKIYSKGRSEIIEQAGRKSFHMWFDLEIEPRWVSMEADLSLPTKSNRKISMMTAFNEELYNAASEFISKVNIYDSSMEKFTDDMIVTLVTKIIHNAIQKLNEKDEPLWNIFIKTPKAKARELEVAKEEFLWKKVVSATNIDSNDWMNEFVQSVMEWPSKTNDKAPTKIEIQENTEIKPKKVIKPKVTKIPKTIVNEKPFTNKTF